MRTTEYEEPMLSEEDYQKLHKISQCIYYGCILSLTALGVLTIIS